MAVLDEFENHGWLKFPSAIPSRLLKSIPHELSRDPHIDPGIIAACQDKLAEILPGAFPVRKTLFSKTGAQSWSLDWHQDRVIAVSEKHETQGFSNWSRKNGYWHTEPPEALFEHMVFVQIYCDETSINDGPPVLASGSHKFGKILSGDISAAILKSETETFLASAGDMVICKPLILHKSLASRSGRARRILRLDFANCDLPAPLEWSFFGANPSTLIPRP